MSRSRAPATGTPVSRLFKMRSLGSIGFIAVLAFYVAWPLYAGYEIKSSLEGHNVEGLVARIDFPSVRASLRPAVAAKVDKVITDTLHKAGTAGGALSDQLKARVMPRIVDGVLASLVTPEMLIRIHASGKTFKEALDSLVMDRASRADGLGGFLIVSEDQSGGGRSRLDEIAGKLGIDTHKVLGGADAKATDVQPQPGAEIEVLPALNESRARPKYGLGNIKHFSLTGPLGLSVGVARDATASKAEITAELSFVNGSWMLTGLVPQT
ncbi:MAG: DUF2939 domain-containing protein [Hyphomicrobium zavarzinii]|jgi:hypothetical protein|uniref:DUF2939 domain-containing protein n=1 Tax=Hyphomicrobium zavarzinii TaxID=48292 RepID=UPI001A59210E|nr:DUF2939 domain-containing protein [Hyphomicrobium zavarzinii]MBL8845573.1 DUF2939 domain-containing protein [Hyphomicrobium zavarzinii]HML42435.1 DUF2939 domain-containing protein [Hyphomicrobium zavarzinii]